MDPSGLSIFMVEDNGARSAQAVDADGPLPRTLAAAARCERGARVLSKHEFVDALKAKDVTKLLSVRRVRREAFERLVLERLDVRGL